MCPRRADAGPRRGHALVRRGHRRGGPATPRRGPRRARHGRDDQPQPGVRCPRGQSPRFSSSRPLSDDDTDRLITALHPDATATEQARGAEPLRRGAALHRRSGRQAQGPAVGRRDHGRGARHALRGAVRTASVQRKVPCGWSKPRPSSAAASNGVCCRRPWTCPEADVDAGAGRNWSTGRVLEPLETDSWRFRHELLREVAAELSPPSLRRELHSRIADSLVSAAAAGNPDWPLIAHHYESAARYLGGRHGATAQASANAWQRGALGEATELPDPCRHPDRALRPGADRDRSEIALRLRRALLAQAAEGVFSPNAASRLRALSAVVQQRLTG